MTYGHFHPSLYIKFNVPSHPSLYVILDESFHPHRSVDPVIMYNINITGMYIMHDCFLCNYSYREDTGKYK